jgi:ABC-type uncharacterized transport system substrate-binding protein
MIKPLLRGIILMVVVGSVLLLADLGNRNRERSKSKSTIAKAISSEGIISEDIKIALIQFVNAPFSEDSENGIKDGLETLVFVKGKEYTLDVYNAQSDISTLNSIVDVVGTSQYDYIMTISTPTLQAMVKKVKTIPVIFTTVADPVAAGAGKNFNEHLPNFTGLSTMSDFQGMVDMIKEVLPGVKFIGTMYNPSEINSEVYKNKLEEIALSNGLEFIAVPAFHSADVLNAAFTLTSHGIDAICQIADNLTGSTYMNIIHAADRAGIPYLGFSIGEVGNGALASVSRDYYVAGVEAVEKLKLLLSGADPGEVPFSYLSKTVYSFNKEVALKHGITIPEKYLKMEK